jgi:hypothetical protein
MSKRHLSSVLIVLSFTSLLAGSAQADSVLFGDSFGGAAVDPAKWSQWNDLRIYDPTNPEDGGSAGTIDPNNSGNIVSAAQLSITAQNSADYWGEYDFVSVPTFSTAQSLTFSVDTTINRTAQSGGNAAAWLSIYIDRDHFITAGRLCGDGWANAVELSYQEGRSAELRYVDLTDSTGSRLESQSSDGVGDFTQNLKLVLTPTAGGKTSVSVYAGGVLGYYDDGSVSRSSWTLDTFSSTSVHAVIGLGVRDGGPFTADFSNLSVATPSFPGDANGDGVVDILDLNRLLTNFDKTGMTWSQGDFDGNGAVDILDLNKLLTNFDKTFSAPAPTLHAVPEPPALALLAIAVFGFLASRRRWRDSADRIFARCAKIGPATG